MDSPRKETLCPECGDTLGSRYHEVAHNGGEDRNYSVEDLEVAAAILKRTLEEARSR